MDTILSRRAQGWHPVRANKPVPVPAKLNVVCAWCKKVLFAGAPKSKTTHGICPDCRAKMLAEDGGAQ
jgi:DNA-directed RNA polymerase subunit RPC12/RpoP